MFKKKLLPVMLTAAFAILAAGQAMLSGTEVCAKGSVSFYTGSSAIDQFMNREPQKIDSVKVPEHCSVSVYNSDEKREKGSITSADKKTVSIEKQHKGAGWFVKGVKEGKTVLSYKRGSEQGKLEAEVLPALKLEAVKKSVKISGGKAELTLTYKNNSDTDIVIEGADTGSAQIRYENEKELSKEAVPPVRWTAKKVTIPAGKTKTFRVTETAKKTAGGIKSFQYPKLYIRFHGVYFVTYVREKGVQGGIDYYGTVPFKEFVKN